LALLQREVYPRKMKDLLKLKQQLEQNSGLVQAKVSSVCVVARTRHPALYGTLSREMCWTALTKRWLNSRHRMFVVLGPYVTLLIHSFISIQP